MQRITEVGILSMGKVMGAGGFLFSIVLCAIYALVIAGVGLAEDRPGMLAVAAGTCLIGPFAYGLVSFLGGLLYALILNLVFRFLGGLEVRIQSVPDEV